MAGLARLAELTKVQAEEQSKANKRRVPDWQEFRKKHPSTQGARVFADRPYRGYPHWGDAVR
jgi:hypothetical protein